MSPAHGSPAGLRIRLRSLKRFAGRHVTFALEGNEYWESGFLVGVDWDWYGTTLVVLQDEQTGREKSVTYRRSEYGWNPMMRVIPGRRVKW